MVQNNGNDTETRELVERLGDPRLKLFHTDAVVSMVENWERGLSRSTGELITVIGDDDALLPDACEAAGYALDLTGAESRGHHSSICGLRISTNDAATGCTPT